MTTKTFDGVVDQQIHQCLETLDSKRKEYATQDRLHNFKIATVLQGMPPERVLAGMMVKHTVSIYDMCKGGARSYAPEAWEEKITDHINYLLLLKAVLAENRNGEG